MTTPKIGLDLLTVGQSSKEVTVNNTSYILDTLVQARVADKDLITPPGSPSDGDTYIVAATATGDWTGEEGNIAYWHAAVGIWQFITPTSESWTIWVEDEALLYRWDGVSAWDVSASIIVAPASLNFTATADGQHALEIVTDAAGYGDVNAMAVDYSSGAIADGEENGVFLINIDESASVGGEVWALGIFATSEGAAEVHALHIGIGVTPLHQHSGSFGDMDSVLVLAVDQTAALVSGGAGNITTFVADNDTITIGDAAIFGAIEIILDTGASGSGIAPTFEYSTGVGTWASFAPTDGTSGFQYSGNIAFDPGDLAGFAVGTGSEYLIRITRTKNSLTTSPIIDEIQISGFVEFWWDENGDVTINDLVAANAVIVSLATTTHALSVTADSLTTGYAALFSSNSSSGLSGSVVRIINDHTGATGTTALSITQDAAAYCVVIDQNGNNQALRIDSESTTTTVINVLTESTTGNVFTITADAVTTARLGYFYSNSASASTRELVKIYNDNPSATGATVLTLRQDAAANALHIDQNADGKSLSIDSEATTVQVMQIDATSTTGHLIRLNANSLTTGSILSLYSNSASASTRSLFFLHNDDPLATGATPLYIQNDSTRSPLTIDMNGNGGSIYIDTEATTASAIQVEMNTATTAYAFLVDNADALTTGGVAYFYSNSADATGRSLVYIRNNNTAAVGAVPLWIRQEAAQDAIFIDQNANAISINIDAESTTSTVFKINATSTTGNLIDLNATALTTGAVISAYSDSASASTRNLVLIWNDNVAATGATCLSVFQDANQEGIRISSQATSSYGMFVTAAAMTTGIGIHIEGSALTSGALLNVYSNSADATARNLVRLKNDHASATGATVLQISQDSTQRAFHIDQNADGISLDIDSSATTAVAIDVDADSTVGIVLDIVANALTTGKMARFYSNSSSASTRNLVEIIQEHSSATGATCLAIQQDAAEQALYIDQNGNSATISIDSESTTTSVFLIATQATTGSIINVPGADTLTTGKILNLVSDSSSGSTRDLAKIHNSNTAAVNTTVLELTQDSTGAGLLIDHNANGRSLIINTTATSAVVVDIDAATTTGAVLAIDADSLTSGEAVRVYSNSSSTTGRKLVKITNDHTSAYNTVPLWIQQDAGYYGLYLDQNGDSSALFVDSAGIVSIAVDIIVNDLTTGKGLRVYSNGAATDTRTLMEITNDNTLATGATCLTLIQDAAQRGLFLDQNGNGAAIVIDSEATTAHVIEIDGTQTTGYGLSVGMNSLTTGRIANFYSDSADVSSRSLVKIVNDNAAATGAIPLHIQQDAAATAFYIDSNANSKALDIDAENTTSDAVSIQCDSITSGDVLQLGMNASNTSTRRILYLNQQHASASGATIMEMKQAADQRALFIDMNGNGKAIDIDAENTTALTIDVQSDALTTGKVARFYSNSADVSTRVLVEIRNDNAAAVGATCLSLNQDANAGSLAMTNSGATDATALEIWANNLTTGRCARFYSNSSSTGSRNLVLIHNDHASATGTVGLTITQDSTGLAMQINGNAAISGSLSKGSGSFLIDHPLKAMNDSHYLRHSFVESPRAENLYSGMVELVDGLAEINIDEHSGMTEGTFLALNTPVSWTSSNEGGFAPVRCSLSGNILTIECADGGSDQIYWEVRGERRDQHMVDTNWTDNEGRVIVEGLKEAA